MDLHYQVNARHHPDFNREKVPRAESTKGKAWATVNFQNLPFKFKLKKGGAYEDLDQATRDRIDAELKPKKGDDSKYLAKSSKKEDKPDNPHYVVMTITHLQRNKYQYLP
jgi:hypothetical protein